MRMFTARLAISRRAFLNNPRLLFLTTLSYEGGLKYLYISRVNFYLRVSNKMRTPPQAITGRLMLDKEKRHSWM